MELVGKVLWWDERDKNGIIVDPQGKEFYFDSSVLAFKPYQKLRFNQIVGFSLNSEIQSTRCAHRVRIPTVKRRSSVQKKFMKPQEISI